MVIAVLQFELLIPQSQSLKDKRRVVSSVKDRLHREHLVSVAEVAALDILTVAVMGLALVSRDPKHAATVLDRIESKLRTLRDAELGDTARDIIAGHPSAHTTGLREFDDDGEPVWSDDELKQIAGRIERESGQDSGHGSGRISRDEENERS